MHLDTATYPYLGRGSELLVAMTGPGVTSPREGRFVGGAPAYAIDATIHLDRDLGSDQAFDVSYLLRFRPTGCSAGTTWIAGMPVLEVSALGISGTVHGSVPLAVSGNHDGCPH